MTGYTKKEVINRKKVRLKELHEGILSNWQKIDKNEEIRKDFLDDLNEVKGIVSYFKRLKLNVNDKYNKMLNVGYAKVRHSYAKGKTTNRAYHRKSYGKE